MFELKSMFAVTNVNMKTFGFPTVKIHSWSLVFQEEDDRIGSFCIQPEEKHLQVYERDIYKSDCQSDIREELQKLVDEFNENPKAHWTELFEKALTELVEYHQRRIDGAKEHVEGKKKVENQLLELKAKRE